MAHRKRDDQSKGTSGKSASPILRANTLCDVPPVKPHVIGVADAKMNLPSSLPGLFSMYVEDVVRYSSPRRIRWPRFCKLQIHNTVPQFTRVKKGEPATAGHRRFGHRERGQSSMIREVSRYRTLPPVALLTRDLQPRIDNRRSGARNASLGSEVSDPYKHDAHPACWRR
jgi:hypothetical protein